MYHIVRTGTCVLVDCIISVSWNWDSSGLCRISRTDTLLVVECIVSEGLVLGQ